MIACICLGLGETILLFLCGLLGLCKLCAKKHLHCKDEHCHDEVGLPMCGWCVGKGHMDDADLGAPATRCPHCKGKGVLQG